MAPLPAAGDPLAARVAGYATACLAAQGALAPAERDGLAEATGALRRRFDRGWDGDYPEFDRARQLLTPARFIETASAAEGG